MINKYAVVGSAKEKTNSKLQYSEIKKALNELGMIETTIENCDCLIFINYNNQYNPFYQHL